jgi:hypothetical protein
MWKLKLFYLFQGTFLFEFLKKFIFLKWKLSGNPLPPPYTVKREEIKKLAQHFGCKTFVETGTFLGATTKEMIKHFNQLYTIELSEELYTMAKHKFIKCDKVAVLQGDSSEILPHIIPGIKNSTLFWLDGHYSGGITAKGEKSCPIYKELEAIFHLKNIDFVLMIDDARLFVNPLDSDYPEIEKLKEFVFKNSPLKMAFEMRLDIISFKPLKLM